jgi:CheY-like chemotaxis protein
MNNILIVEDEKVIIEFAFKILSAKNYNVDKALNTNEAWTLLKDNKYDIIITDLMLPDTSGFNFIKMIKKKFSEVPIILITGYATKENIIGALLLGIFDFVPKPFSHNELLNVILRASRYSKVDDFKEYLMKISNENAYKEYYFFGEHSWIRIDSEDSIVIGAGRAFYKSLGEIVRVQLPFPNEEISQGSECVKIFTDQKYAHRVWSPLSGQIIECNLKVQGDYSLVNYDSFDKGWLIRMKPNNLKSELADLTKVTDIQRLNKI